MRIKRNRNRTEGWISECVDVAGWKIGLTQDTIKECKCLQNTVTGLVDVVGIYTLGQTGAQKSGKRRHKHPSTLVSTTLPFSSSSQHSTSLSLAAGEVVYPARATIKNQRSIRSLLGVGGAGRGGTHTRRDTNLSREQRVRQAKRVPIWFGECWRRVYYKVRQVWRRT
jgi:hypothetical protein